MGISNSKSNCQLSEIAIMTDTPKQHIPNIPTPVLIPPSYDQVLKEATIEPISTDEILIPHEHFIQQRKRFYEQAYVVGCNKCIVYMNSALKSNIGKKYIEVNLGFNLYKDPLQLLSQIPKEYHDYNESRTLFERLKDYILNAYKPFKIVVKDYDSRHGYLTIIIYYERNIMSEMIMT